MKVFMSNDHLIIPSPFIIFWHELGASNEYLYICIYRYIYIYRLIMYVLVIFFSFSCIRFFFVWKFYCSAHSVQNLKMCLLELSLQNLYQVKASPDYTIEYKHLRNSRCSCHPLTNTGRMTLKSAIYSLALSS